MEDAHKAAKRNGPTHVGLRRSLVLLFALATAGMGVEPAEFVGRWMLDRGRSDNIEQAVDRALEPENIVTRMMARKRILRAAKAPETMQIALAGDGILVTTETQSPPAVPIGGAPVIWMRPKGTPVKIKMAINTTQMVETFEADYGTRVQRFALSNEGKALSVEVDVASPRLERKITYRVWFSRSPNP
ncbi:MAG: hypothetical protein IPO40_06780 [Fibrobacteres bacterium]|nr:hypothetical protein [Fibrobacterota bacterium]